MMKPRIFINVFARRTAAQVRRGAVAIVLAALACATAPAFAQGSYPNRPVKLIIGFSPGGAVDGIGREVAKGLSALWDHPVIVENKPDLRQVTQTEAYRRRLAALGSEARTSTRDEIARRIRAESSRNQSLLSGMGI